MTLSTVLVGSHLRIRDIRQCMNDLSVPVTAEFDSASKCLSTFPLEAGSKHLFAVDVTSDDGLRDLEVLSTQYRNACMAVLDSSLSNPGPFLQKAMRAGACQVVGRPLDLGDVSSAMSCINRLFGEPSAPCTMIAVTGASGGCGATTLAINLAHELEYLTGAKCILSEQEEHMSMLASCLDLKPRHTLGDLMKLPQLDAGIVEQALVPYGEGHLRILCGSHGHLSGASIPDNASPESLARLIAILRGMCQFLVFDVSCTLSPAYFEVLSRADRVTIVAEQSLPSMRNLRLLQDALRPFELQSAIDVVVNKFDSRVAGFSLAGIKDIVATDRVWTVENAPTVALGALNLGRPLRVHSERASIVEDISKLARGIATDAGCNTLKPVQSTSFFNFLRRLA